MSYVEDICRICANAVDLEKSCSLFDGSHKIALKQIAELAGILLRNNKKLPTVMCMQCEVDLKQAYAFRERCINTQIFFKATQTKEEDEVASNENSEDDVKLEIEIVKEEAEQENNIELEEEFVYLSEQIEELTDDIVVYDEHSDYEQMTEEIQEDVEFLPIDDAYLEDLPDSSSDSEPPKKSPKKLAKKAATPKQPKQPKPKKANKTYFCDQCGNNFDTSQKLVIHLRRHAGEKPFKCELCPSEFITNSQLCRHMRRHTGERPYECQYCGRRFTDYSTRTKHERIHTNERPFVCKVCGKAFMTGYVLKNHMVIHSGERSFVCKLCNKSYQSQSHLIAHQRSIMHKQNEERQQLTNMAAATLQSQLEDSD